MNTDLDEVSLFLKYYHVFFLFFLHLAEHVVDERKIRVCILFHGPYLNFTYQSCRGVPWIGHACLQLYLVLDMMAFSFLRGDTKSFAAI